MQERYNQLACLPKVQVQPFHCVLKYESLLWAQQKLVPILRHRFVFFAAFDVDFCVSMFPEHLFQGTSQL